MATIFKKTADGFSAFSLTGRESSAPSVDPAVYHNAADCEFSIVPFRDGTRPNHALIAGGLTPVRVNGLAVVGSLRVLDHKDELMLGESQMFFSAESAPVVETYQHDGSTRLPRCPVCRGEIADGHTVVCCPGCSRIYHLLDATDGSPAKPCWTYSPTCRFCEHPTSMSGEPTWQPEVDETR